MCDCVKDEVGAFGAELATTRPNARSFAALRMTLKDYFLSFCRSVSSSLVISAIRLGRIRSVTRDTEDKFPVLKVELKYGKGRQRTITNLNRVSRPGRRVYAKRDNLPRVLGGLAIAILSTSRGLMTDRQASKQGLGGEVLAYIW